MTKPAVTKSAMIKRRILPGAVPVTTANPGSGSAGEQAVVCARLFVACSGLLRGLIRRLPFAELRYADRQKLRRTLTRLEADLRLARTALGVEGQHRLPAKSVETLPVSDGR